MQPRRGQVLLPDAELGRLGALHRLVDPHPAPANNRLGRRPADAVARVVAAGRAEVGESRAGVAQKAGDGWAEAVQEAGRRGRALGHFRRSGHGGGGRTLGFEVIIVVVVVENHGSGRKRGAVGVRVVSVIVVIRVVRAVAGVAIESGRVRGRGWPCRAFVNGSIGVVGAGDVADAGEQVEAVHIQVGLADEAEVHSGR